MDATDKIGRRTRTTVKQRSRVQDLCARELFRQTAVGSPKIALLLERVWDDRTALLMETVDKLEHQIQARDSAQKELLNVTRSAGLHAERTKRVGNQWEVQKAGVLESLRDTQAELHSMTVERNQLRKEVEQLRSIIDDYVNGIPMSKKKQLLKAQSAGHGIGDGIVDMKAIVEASASKKKIETETVHFDSDDEDLEDLTVRDRVKSVRQADKKIDSLLLELMSEKRAQKAAIRGSQKLITRFLSTQLAMALGLRKQ